MYSDPVADDFLTGTPFVLLFASIFQGDIAYIRVKEDNPKGSRSRSNSPKRSRGSPRYSPMRERERSYSPYN